MSSVEMGTRINPVELLRRLLQIGDHSFPLLRLAQANEVHRAVRDELLRLGQKSVERLLRPDDVRVFHRLRIGPAGSRSGLATEDAVQIGPVFLSAPGIERMASLALLEDLLALRHIRRLAG